MISTGMDGLILKHLCQVIPRTILADILGTGTSNYSRLYKRRLTKLQTDQIVCLAMFWTELRVSFDENDMLIQERLKTPITTFKTKRPIDLMSTHIGRKLLRKFIDI